MKNALRLTLLLLAMSSLAAAEDDGLPLPAKKTFEAITIRIAKPGYHDSMTVTGSGVVTLDRTDDGLHTRRTATATRKELDAIAADIETARFSSISSTARGADEKELRVTFELAAKEKLVVSRTMSELRPYYEGRLKPLVQAMTAIEQRIEKEGVKGEPRVVVRSEDGSLTFDGETAIVRSKDGTSRTVTLTDEEKKTLRAVLRQTSVTVSPAPVAKPLTVTVTHRDEKGASSEETWTTRTAALNEVSDAIIGRATSSTRGVAGALVTSPAK